jgi:hypothetical protein
MPQKPKAKAKPKTRLRRAASSVKKIFKRSKPVEKIGPDDTTVRMKPARQKPAAKARAPRREADIPFDRIENAYTPTQTSLKSSFRTSGADHQRDQEFAGGVADDRWNDEDRFTNKSGDPRIGTHGRKYEPGE